MATDDATTIGAATRPAWVERLLLPAAWPHPVERVTLVETHISWVFLTGPFAYKVKKPLKLEFLDFSTPDRRRYYCEEEVRLNRRFAPGLYLGTVPIGGTAAAPRVGGEPDDSSRHRGEPALREWAVKLVQFDEACRLDALFDAGRLAADDCVRLGEEIARVESTLAVADPSKGYGTPERLAAVFAMNLGEIVRHRPDVAARARAVGEWLGARLERDRGAFLERVAGGRIRECHGDLHLANIVLLDGRPVAFDSIEFNPELRWIDVASDIAFLTMDLESRGRADLAAHVTSAWMETADDHGAATVLPVHRVARAVVRAAVAAIRGAQADCAPVERTRARAECDRYLALAERLMAPPAPVMLVVTGVSGCGKSTLAGRIVGRLGAVRLRSDVERKRLAGMAPADRPDGPAAVAALYSAESTGRVYGRLAELARTLLAAGTSVVVDATGNTRAERRLLAAAATDRGVPLAWLDVDLPESTLVERVDRRRREGHDPSDATVDVLRRQLAAREPIGANETAPDRSPCTIRVPVGVEELADPDALVDGVAAALRGSNPPGAGP